MEAAGGIHVGSALETPRWAVRIRGEDGEIAGAGVLLSSDRVLTCAHVVPCGAQVTAEFVGARGPTVPSVTAWVDAATYVPETQDDDGDPIGDVALLRLEHSRPADEPVKLHRLSAPNRSVRMYGFPRDHNGGIFFRATIVGGCGRDGQVQLSPVTPGELASPGCSGAGVVDDLTGKVIGMVLSGLRDRHGNLFSFMSPAETVIRHVPEVARWTEGKAAVDGGLVSHDDGTAQDLLDESFAQRLARWLRGDGQQVKISLVPADDRTRVATLRRAITLADRELRTQASTGNASLGPPGTVPSAGSHDLAVDATGRTAAGIAERVAERMGLWQHPSRPVTERIRAAETTLTLVVVDVDQAVDPFALLELLTVLREQGSRLLLTFRTTGTPYHRARHELVAKPAQERRARIVERLEESTGPLAAALRERTAAVLDEEARHTGSALIRAHAALARLSAAQDIADRSDQGPDLTEHEKLADRVRARLTRTVGRLDTLLRRRDELRGRLQSYHMLYRHSTKGEEDLETDALYLRAHELLHARPCDVRAAEEAVGAYIDRVEQRDRASRGGAWPL